MNSVPTPEEFTQKVRETLSLYEGDKEIQHCETDGLMESLLELMGYGEAIEMIRGSVRWYA